MHATVAFCSLPCSSSTEGGVDVVGPHDVATYSL
jgi:hypothetical protein